MFEDNETFLFDFASGGKIHIAPSKKGTFTAAAKKHGKSVQAFASQVLAHKENYSPAMVKKANFARNAAKWHGDGGLIERFGADAVRKALANKYAGGSWLKKAGKFMQNVGQLASENARDVRTATASSTVKDMIDAGREEDAYNFAKQYTKYGLLGTALGIGAGPAAPQVEHAVRVLANPATANTTAEAKIATAVDAAGLVSGANGLSEDATKAVRGEYGWSDVPKTLLDATILLPGSSQFTNPQNVRNLVDAGKTISFIPKITSTSTAVNRIAHPVESYRFANVAKRAGSVLPQPIYDQTITDLSKTRFFNEPFYKTADKYSIFNRKPADHTLGVYHGYKESLGRYVTPEVYGLGDRFAKTDFSRAHELGHLVEDAAKKRGYDIINAPHLQYQYIKGDPYISTADPVTAFSESFADTFGNSITSDMSLEIPDILETRYPYIKNDIPMFAKRWKP